MSRKYLIELGQVATDKLKAATDHPDNLISLAGTVGITFLRLVEHVHTGKFGVAFQVPDNFDLAQFRTLFPQLLQIIEVKPVTVPPTPQQPKYMKTNSTPIAPSGSVTLDQTMDYLGLNKIRSNPQFNGGKGVIVAMVDTGIDATHGGTDLCFVQGAANSNTPSRILAHVDYAGGPPYHPHGTWTSQIVGRSALSDGTYKGGLDQCSFVYAQVLDSTGNGSSLEVADGVNWAIGQKAHVINMSLGGTPDDVLINQSIYAAYQAGIIVCASSGNSGVTGDPPCDGKIGSPADSDYAVACGATSIGPENSDGGTYVISFTSRGNRYDSTPPPHYVVAPGVNIQPGYGDNYYSGTSFSAPCTTVAVGTMIAWLLNNNKTWTVPQLWAALQNSCKLLGYEKDPAYTQAQAYCIEGYGEVLADQAFNTIGGTNPTQPPTGRVGFPISSNVVSFTVTVGTGPVNPPQPDPREADNLILTLDASNYSPSATVTAKSVLTFTSDHTPMTSRNIQYVLNPGSKIVGSSVTDSTGASVLTFTAPSPTVTTTYTLTANFSGDQIASTPANEPKLNSAACGPITITYEMPPIVPLPAQSSGNAGEPPMPPNAGYSNPIMTISSDTGAYVYGSASTITITGTYPDGTPIVGKPFILLMATYDAPNQWNSFVKMSDSTGKAVFGMIPFAQPPVHPGQPPDKANVSFIGEYLGDGTTQN